MLDAADEEDDDEKVMAKRDGQSRTDGGNISCLSFSLVCMWMCAGAHALLQFRRWKKEEDNGKNKNATLLTTATKRSHNETRIWNRFMVVVLPSVGVVIIVSPEMEKPNFGYPPIVLCLNTCSMLVNNLPKFWVAKLSAITSLSGRKDKFLRM